MSVRPGRKKSKNPSYFSHEFVITNHGDIVSFVAMILVMGLLNKATHSFSSSFLFIQYNVTDEERLDDYHDPRIMYTTGRKDLCVIFFYTVITVVLHAVLQEYIFDRFAKKLNLTKVRVAKLNESAHHACFFMLSVCWGVYNVVNENLVPSLSSFWESYPEDLLPFWSKMFIMIQICYWLHDFPELYFQRVKKELIPSRILHALMFLLGVSLSYVGGLSKLCIVLLLLHYSTDIFLHVGRALHLSEYTKIASVFFAIWNILFIPVRMACLILPFLVLHYGLGSQSVQSIDLATGNFNTPSIRLSAMIFLFISQAYMVWNFITFHQRSRRDKQSSNKSGWFGLSQDANNKKLKEKKKAKRDEDEGSDTVVESADLDNHRELRRRKPVKSRPQ